MLIRLHISEKYIFTRLVLDTNLAKIKNLQSCLIKFSIIFKNTLVTGDQNKKNGLKATPVEDKKK